MAGHAGNYYTIAVGKQTAKGTPQTTPTYKLRVTGGGIGGPTRNETVLTETDSSRQARPSVVVGERVGPATTSHYIRSDEFPLLAYGVMGANADSGANPYTHTATSAATLPYFTLFEAFDSTAAVTRFADCRLNQMRVRGQAGEPLTCELEWWGLASLFGSTDPVLAASSAVPHTWPLVTVTKGGATTACVSEFDIEINNNLEWIECDNGLEPVDIQPGRWEVSGSMLVLFETDADYRSFHTGSPSGTTVSSTLFTEALTITSSRSASNDEISFTMTAVEYTAFPLQPDAGGDPIRVAMAWRAQPQTTIANTLSIVTKNITAAY